MTKFFAIVGLWMLAVPLNGILYSTFATFLHNNIVEGVAPIGFTTGMQLSLWVSLFVFVYSVAKAVGEAVVEA